MCTEAALTFAGGVASGTGPKLMGIINVFCKNTSMLLYVLLSLLFVCLCYVKQNYRLVNPDMVGSVQ